MKIIIFLHELVIGGTTVNAIELGMRLRDRYGHEVSLFAPSGPMLEMVRRSGLRYLPAPQAHMHPCAGRMRALRDAVRTHQPDLIYVWETWAFIDAYCAAYLSMAVPLLLTDMQSHVAKLLPRTIPTTFGVQSLVEQASSGGMKKVSLLLPPVDMAANAAGSHDLATERTRFGVAPDEILLVIVSRLAHTTKGDSLRLAIDLVGAVGADQAVKLLIVGDGPARGELECRAREVNQLLGRDAVVFAGALLDPRPAYAAADIVIGMGSSAMRAMAYEKPVVVVGEAGFAHALTPDTAAMFEHQGLFGIGTKVPAIEQLMAEISPLIESRERREQLGRFSIQFARRHFDLEVIAAQLNDLCESAVSSRPGRGAVLLDVLRTAAFYLRDRRFRWRADVTKSPPLADVPAHQHSVQSTAK